MKTFFEFKLKESIGDNIKDLILYAPRNIHKPITSKINSMVGEAFFIMSQKNLQKSDAIKEIQDSIKEENKDPNSKQICDMLMYLPSSNNERFYETFCIEFKNLICSDGICKIKGKSEKLSEGYYNSILMEDGDRLMGEYLDNFFTIFDSLTKNPTMKT